MTKTNTTTYTTTYTPKPSAIYTYRISCEGVGGLPAPDKDVEAAYFQQDGEFTVFKDGVNAAVYSVKNSVLLTVERLAVVSPDQDD